MISVLLLDDHAVVRHGYRQWIDGEPDMRVVAEASTSAQACELLRQVLVDVAVVDLSLKGDSGLEAMRRMKERLPGLKMLVLTMHDHPGYALQAFRLGAMGYITKDSDPQQLLDALRQVATGQRVVPDAGDGAVPHPTGAALQDLFKQLTPREFEVLRLMLGGQDAQAVARALHVSEKTVNNTMSLIRQKLGERNDFRLMLMATEYGLTPA
ncbi:response regulator containing a CheY-like receiver domain and an HTH DNA-binding domain [Burkholderiales bacterium JOSHI_001]|nr:response regulator containing a CheY-like receiver domain and an HTH DNA-binding domain [Burkholderiales bacterium JOSHI_001]